MLIPLWRLTNEINELLLCNYFSLAKDVSHYIVPRAAPTSCIIETVDEICWRKCHIHFTVVCTIHIYMWAQVTGGGGLFLFVPYTRRTKLLRSECVIFQPPSPGKYLANKCLQPNPKKSTRISSSPLPTAEKCDLNIFETAAAASFIHFMFFC